MPLLTPIRSSSFSCWHGGSLSPLQAIFLSLTSVFDIKRLQKTKSSSVGAIPPWCGSLVFAPCNSWVIAMLYRKRSLARIYWAACIETHIITRKACFFRSNLRARCHPQVFLFVVFHSKSDPLFFFVGQKKQCCHKSRGQENGGRRRCSQAKTKSEGTKREAWVKWPVSRLEKLVQMKWLIFPGM